MSLSRQWINALANEWIIPEVIPERCVHTQCEVSTCTRCVDSCPRQAWILDDSGLHINTTLCDGCGLCVAACTESALEQTLQPAQRLLAGSKMLLFACERIGEGCTGEGVVPCLHSISASLLIECYTAGFEQIYVSRGSCETCSRQREQAFTLQQSLHTLNQLLANRQAPSITWKEIPFAEWDLQRKQLKPCTLPSVDSPVTKSNRRNFLRQAITFALEKSLEAKTTGELKPEKLTPWPNKLPHAAEIDSVLYAFAIHIDTVRCNGCNACAQLCPHQAIQLVKDAKGRAIAYELTADNCTGCTLCEDACDQQAVQIHPLHIQPQTSIQLVTQRCKACGNPFHYPVDANLKARAYCRICAQTNHHRQLYQIV